MHSQLLRDVIKIVIIEATLIIMRLCNCGVCRNWVDTSVNHPANIVCFFGLNVWRERTKIRAKTTKWISANIINPFFNVSCIALTLCSTSWTNLWQDPKCTWFHADRQWSMAIAMRAINVGLILSINDLSFTPIHRVPWMYIWLIWSTIPVTANRNLHSSIDCQGNG